jgi:alpha-tubulin suppressor-like RCC1 family protein
MTANTFARSGKPFLNSYTASTSLDSDLSDIFIPRDVFSDGGLWLWGSNSRGELGDNTIASKSSPVQTITGGNVWKQIANGGQHTLAIKTDGRLWAWGYNNRGQLGTNNVTNRSSPVQTITGGTNWKQVDCGSTGHSAAIKTDGTLWLWGYNNQGQLGDNTRTSRSSPVQAITGGANWKQVSLGGAGSFTAATKTDGTLWTWGYNLYGQLGTNNVTRRSSPVQTVSGGTNWYRVASGGYHIAAIKTDGTLWTWGLNSAGQLGTNDITRRSSPVQTVSGGTNWRVVACGVLNTAAIKTDGTLWMWGSNNYGELGNNTITSRSSPTQTISGGTNWKQLSCGDYHTLAIKTDGTLWVWGNNGSGRLGDNTSTRRSSPVQTIMGGTNWKQVDGSSSSSAAIKDDSIF